MEGWVDLGVGYILRWFTCPQTVTHPGTNHLIATWPGVEPTTSRSQVLRPNRYTTKPPTSDNSTRCGRGVRLTIQYGVHVVYVWQFNTVWTWCNVCSRSLTSVKLQAWYLTVCRNEHSHFFALSQSGMRPVSFATGQRANVFIAWFKLQHRRINLFLLSHELYTKMHKTK